MSSLSSDNAKKIKYTLYATTAVVSTVVVTKLVARSLRVGFAVWGKDESKKCADEPRPSSTHPTGSEVPDATVGSKEHTPISH